ncbi:ABC transporter ATP-binding protein [Nocardia camponoti]|uniref:ABC transporter ATP-binding protein n=1 Tax=Nocardia camponoti TaxID=1616106 RepID=A0A917VC57_9NOCA|nr:ABC transporter ATP-binding protein [Nocardia camponoti]GGK61852.1 ABC transporter ATP-binding protein [Nocardia camponoti]
MSLLEVTDLTVGYVTAAGERVVLVDSVSLRLEPGEVLCLVGESGSGKSVTMLAVLGLLTDPLTVFSGSVRFRGKELIGADDETLRKLRGAELGMIFQDPMTSLNPVRRVGTQIGRALAVHQQSDRRTRERKVVELLDAVGIPQPAERARAYPHQWSGGMRQRAVIAMAMANDPAILIADEPTTALDVTVQAQLMAVLAEARERSNAAMVLITHDLGLVAQYADRVAIMYAGRVVEQGTVWQIFDSATHPYTLGLRRSLIGEQSATERAYAIPGAPPPPTKRPAGCGFAPRCEFANKASECETHVPALVTLADGRAIACPPAQVAS